MQMRGRQWTWELQGVAEVMLRANVVGNFSLRRVDNTLTKSIFQSMARMETKGEGFRRLEAPHHRPVLTCPPGTGKRMRSRRGRPQNGCRLCLVGTHMCFSWSSPLGGWRAHRQPNRKGYYCGTSSPWTGSPKDSSPPRPSDWEQLRRLKPPEDLRRSFRREELQIHVVASPCRTLHRCLSLYSCKVLRKIVTWRRDLQIKLSSKFIT